ncbi:unnamed protein product [Calicophoron daubneyi]|uniref:long-chain-fatty-acid--CoA ligase n=1 Tax=Calicophoron daubneyi TaxID=300641 RepID=A0AAV2TF24_CALDB
MGFWIKEQLMNYGLGNNLTTLGLTSALIVAYAAYQWYLKGCNSHSRIKISPHIKNQSRLIDESAGVRVSVLGEDEGWDETMVTMYDTFLRGLKKSRHLPCFGKRLTVEDPIYWLTYDEVHQQIRAVGSAILHLTRDSKEEHVMVGLYGKNSPEWLSTLIACSAYNLVAVPLYNTLGEDAVKYVFHQVEPVIVLCDTAQLARQISEWSTEKLKHVVVIQADDAFEELRTSGRMNTKLLSFKELLSIGREELQPTKAAQPDDLFLVGYTSGSTGPPKGTLLSHKNCMTSTVIGIHLLGLSDYTDNRYIHLSYLPLAHCYERIVVSAFLYSGGQIGFLTGDIQSLIKDLQDYHPTYFSTVPRILIQIYNKVLQKVGKSKLTMMLFRLAIRQKISEQKRGILNKSGLLDSLFFKPVRDMVGGDVRLIVSASAPISDDLLNFTRAVFCCPVVEAYGSTETGGVISATLPGDVNTGHCGALFRHLEVKLADVPEMGLVAARDRMGEICVRGPGCSKGFYNDPERTKELFDSSGFLRMGDIGLWTENGALKVVDRCKSIFKLSQGEYISPKKIEELYSSSLLVSHIFVDGDPCKSFVVAIVEPNFDEVRKRIAGGNFSRNGFRSDELRRLETIPDEKLCNHRIVKKILLDEFTMLGKKGGLKGFEQVKAIYLCTGEFSISNGLLTPTMKMCRPNVRRRFRSVIDQIYRDFELENPLIR